MLGYRYPTKIGPEPKALQGRHGPCGGIDQIDALEGPAHDAAFRVELPRQGFAARDVGTGADGDVRHEGNVRSKVSLQHAAVELIVKVHYLDAALARNQEHMAAGAGDILDRGRAANGEGNRRSPDATRSVSAVTSPAATSAGKTSVKWRAIADASGSCCARTDSIQPDPLRR